jgi:hypothetical protein
MSRRAMQKIGVNTAVNIVHATVRCILCVQQNMTSTTLTIMIMMNTSMKKMIAQARARDKETAKEKATITKHCVFTTQTIAAQPLRCLIPASVRGFFYLLQKKTSHLSLHSRHTDLLLFR